MAGGLPDYDYSSVREDLAAGRVSTFAWDGCVAIVTPAASRWGRLRPDSAAVVNAATPMAVTMVRPVQNGFAWVWWRQDVRFSLPPATRDQDERGRGGFLRVLSGCRRRLG